MKKSNFFPIDISKTPLAEVGQKVFIIGYPLFSPLSGLSSTITTGIISKIGRVGGIPTMIQTCAQVHKGNSGGLLVNGNGELLGLITSNARHQVHTKDSTRDILIPSLNFSIPVDRLKFIDLALRKNDLNILEEYNKTNKHIQDMWEFKDIDETKKPKKFQDFLEKVKEFKSSKL